MSSCVWKSHSRGEGFTVRKAHWQYRPLHQLCWYIADVSTVVQSTSSTTSSYNTDLPLLVIFKLVVIFRPSILFSPYVLYCSFMVFIVEFHMQRPDRFLQTLSATWSFDVLHNYFTFIFYITIHLYILFELLNC